MKKFFTFALIGLAVAGGAAALWKQIHPTHTASGAAPAAPAPAALPRDGVVVTYFTTNVRCPSCRQIEALARQAVATHFGAGENRDRIVFQVINTDLPENRHFVDHYQIAAKTVIVSRRENGAETDWINLQDVWLKLGDPAGFDAYVTEAVTRRLTDGGF